MCSLYQVNNNKEFAALFFAFFFTLIIPTAKSVVFLYVVKCLYFLCVFFYSCASSAYLFDSLFKVVHTGSDFFQMPYIRLIAKFCAATPSSAASGQHMRRFCDN